MQYGRTKTVPFSGETTTVVSLPSRDDANAEKQHVDITNLGAGSDDKVASEDNRPNQGAYLPSQSLN